MTDKYANETLTDQLSMLYQMLDGSEAMAAYSKRHDIQSAAILTIYDDDTADTVSQYLAPRIEGRTVVEIGGGIGLLAFHMAQYAKRVICIEANVAWSTTFAAILLDRKPKNVSYLFGAASEFYGNFQADIALFCTHSDAAGMREVGSHFATEVIDVYGKVCSSNWNELRAVSNHTVLRFEQWTEEYERHNRTS